MVTRTARKIRHVKRWGAPITVCGKRTIGQGGVDWVRRQDLGAGNIDFQQGDDVELANCSRCLELMAVRARRDIADRKRLLARLDARFKTIGYPSRYKHGGLLDGK